MAAVLTPYRAKGMVDFEGMRKLARFLAGHGCEGLFVPSSTGEIFLLDDATRRKLVEEAREGAGAEMAIWAGASGMGARHAIELSKDAARAGADGVIVMAPCFLKLSQTEVEDYLRCIADASPLPVGIYHHLRMPTAIEVETAARLAAHPNIVLLKDTSADLERIKALVAATRGHAFRIYQGSESLFLSSLEAGADGGITALGNLLPELHRKIADSFFAGDDASARQAQGVLMQFWKIFRQPEVGAAFSCFVRSLTLPLSWRGVLDKPASMHADGSGFAEFDRWLAEYYAGHGLNAHLPAADV